MPLTTRLTAVVGRTVALLAAALGLAGTSAAEPETTARLNGVATPVYFNDGDTFRSLAGTFRRRPARLAGFNTLESYGPVHQWGGWTFRELYAVAKQATLNARRGVWTCQVDASKRDGYGRILADCPDLAADQVSKGLAHAFGFEGPAEPRLVQLQREAIVARRGIWAKGVPPLVLTSLHSVDERLDNADNYNRLVSPLDGISTKWKHQDRYDECQVVCHRARAPERAAALATIARLRADATTGALVRGLEDVYLMAVLAEYATTGRVAQVFPGKGDEVVARALTALTKEGVLGTPREVDGSCMVYASFDRRYRVKPKPRCLKW